MAIIVSINANYIASAQLSLANDAQRIATIPYLPNIKARIKYLSSEGGARKERMEITNSGDTMYELHADPIAFLELREWQIVPMNATFDQTVHLRKALAPVESYFPSVTWVDGDGKDLLLSQDIANTNLMDDRLDAFSKKYHSDKKIVTGRIKKYVAVSYIDRFKTEHVDYFEFVSTGEGVLMDSTEGNEIFSRHDELRRSKDKLSYTNSSPDDIDRLWIKLRK